MSGNKSSACWCGNSDLREFDADYGACDRCGTLVLRDMPSGDVTDVKGDEAGLYGRDYWFTHQEQEVGFPNITRRSRTDLPERCVHWMRTVLRYRTPPGKTLELGAAHGGFVAMMRWAGFDATGLELSPWICDYARKTFGVPMLQGPVERQPVAAESLDVVLMMDVIEHLPDPVGTLRHCVSLLKPDGVLVIQTPEYPQGQTLEQLKATGSKFVQHLRPREHLYLLGRRAATELISQVGCPHVCFEPAMFAEYDQFFVASRSPLPPALEKVPDTAREALERTPTGRFIGALLDLADGRDFFAKECAARLDVIHVLDAEVKRLQSP